MLSEDEYLDQSRIETQKALENLREYCLSPKCNSWKIASRLDSPTRFAEFVQGSSHLTQHEVMEYSQVDFNDDEIPGYIENQSNHPEMTDDDSSDDTDI